ncbi:AGE family epimerase/isomerase [Sphingomonas guangdongensis]|uniref:AGE family epimerase/isomerase n=1 Tax=Sphingomonas guangdongensis TaxID=1141890 RepID=UPI0015CAF298|nr:AGE family epimerase/isomerase [Sphingomonas guangdongensis]
MDARCGGFVERLSWSGEPDVDAAKRLRVQARQIYVFSHAKLLGLAADGDAVAGHGYDFVRAYGFPDGIAGGAVHAVSRTGVVVDAKRDTYDHAFLLFAWSWYARATDRDDVRRAVAELGDATWALLGHPSGTGLVVDDQGTPGFHQNPHMHLFEAVLAAWEATGEPIFLDRARTLFDLFQQRLFDRRAGVLREFYDDRWAPAAGSIGEVIEPGHHAEWVWLLDQYAQAVGEPLCDEAFRLYDFIERHGRNRAGTLLIDEVRPDGTVTKPSTRSWPQTEALKAELVMARLQDGVSAARSDAIVATLFNRFLAHPVPGCWIDWIDTDGRPLVDRVPASTFYHIFLALSEYLRARP